MKVLLIDNVTDGHHMAYATCLASSPSYESVLALPDGKGDVSCPNKNLSGFRPMSYLCWVRGIRRIVKETKPDVVHFLNANALVNYCGVGLGWLRRYRTIFTYHLHFGGKLKHFGHRRLAKIGTSVVHTASLARTFAAYGGKVVHIEYPNFLQEDAPFSRDRSVRTLLALGQTRRDKGLDILLEALDGVKADFRLVVAGAPVDFDEAFIREKTAGYADKVRLDLRFLPQEVMRGYLKEADYIVLPYRRVFDGASGPLTEGVGYEKPIIGPDCGSLGEIIREHHIGYTFPCESAEGLRKCIEKALSERFAYDETAKRYREYLSPERFKREYAELYGGL